MQSAIPKEMTPEEFLLFAEQHPDKRFDFIRWGDGRSVAKAAAWPETSGFHYCTRSLYETKPSGHCLYRSAACLERREIYPDVCINAASDADYLTSPPLFVVEIRSESQSKASQRKKARDYIRLGVKMVVLVLPGESVEVYRSDKEVVILTADDILDGEDVLPNFKLALSQILP